jgi:hypothetical protein
MTNPFPMMRCAYCGRTPDQIPTYVVCAEESDMTPWAYVKQEEGTYNHDNGHFACDDCYVEIGMPSSPTGWVAP